MITYAMKTVGDFIKFTEGLPNEMKVISKDSNFELRGAYTERRMNVGDMKEVLHGLVAETSLIEVEALGYDLIDAFGKISIAEIQYMDEVVGHFVDAFDGTPYLKTVFKNGSLNKGEKVICLY